MAYDLKVAQVMDLIDALRYAATQSIRFNSQPHLKAQSHRWLTLAAHFERTEAADDQPITQ